ncbi:MAG: DUF5700 domain-containing putative Zn-dependent protease [Bacteroidota bacterium]
MKWPVCPLALVILLGRFAGAFAQTNPKFNVDLRLNFAVAEQCVDLYEDRFVSTQELAGLRGSLVAASTTGLIANSGSVAARLQSSLDSLKYHDFLRDDIYHLEDARKNVTGIKELLGEMKKQNFNRRVVATVEQIFPQDADISLTIPVYVVAFGHENVDAYVRRILWRGDMPQFVGEGEGELTIVINLAHAVNYGQALSERFISLLGVTAHEVFHAAFGAYKENSSTWKRYYGKHRGPFHELIDLTQNEGIAYYLSLDQLGHGNLPRDWYNRTREVFSTFNANATELLSDKLTPSRASELIRTANLSGYRDNYGAMAGMVMAREIDLRMGRAALVETIALGPIDFFRKYLKLSDEDSNLPRFNRAIAGVIAAD